ncbi:MAG: SIS domain-containing protein [Clostridia bacterium]|nr:SIS domain-containing protein [Clostridia bacterium]
MKPNTEEILNTLVERYPALSDAKESVSEAYKALYDALYEGHAVYTCGNGGSDADARHIVGELRKSFRLPRPVTEDTRDKLSLLGEDGEYLIEHLERALPVFCLNENSSLISAYENDAAPDAALAQSLFGAAKQGDVLLAISTSGNSRNCVLAATLAKAMGLVIVSLTGAKPSKLSDLSDVTIAVPETETYKVQEMHLPVYHALCAMLESEFYYE